MSNITNSLANVPVLRSAKDYTIWSLAIMGRAMLMGVWVILQGEQNAPEAKEGDKDLSAFEDRLTKHRNEVYKAKGLLIATTSEDLKLVLGSLKMPSEGPSATVFCS